MLRPERVQAFVEAAEAHDADALPRAALLIGQVEYPDLDLAPTMRQLNRLGALAISRIERLGADAPTSDRIDTLNTLLFDDEGFHGNEARYDDPRNSFLNDVIERRTGIPVSLSLVYIDVARRAGLTAEGVNFPGHFLVRIRPRSLDGTPPVDIVLDPFNRGVRLSEADCRALARAHLGEDVRFSRQMLAAASKRQMLARMLMNLKRLYVAMRSFGHARDVVGLLLALDPHAPTELRDRGLLSYHLQDFSPALRDLERYLRDAAFTPPAEAPQEESQSEYQQIWEHVKNLRRRLAGLN
ncbi:MAG: tetratricopeptide repeat protein [Vicinamibacteraceae bacterium]|nr:tetratricopeptide repeat protein [Vicinamibacteraceae bacterium]